MQPSKQSNRARDVASGVNSISHLTAEHFLLYIHSEIKEPQNLSNINSILLASVCKDLTLPREGRCMTITLRNLAGVFKKRPSLASFIFWS